MQWDSRTGSVAKFLRVQPALGLLTIEIKTVSRANDGDRCPMG